MADPESRLASRDRVWGLQQLYGALLTERQRELLAWYYDLDLSLGEIAEQGQVSRQAVHDLLRRAVAALEGYEGRLHLAERAARRRGVVVALLGEIETARRAGGQPVEAALGRAAALAGAVLEG